MVVDALTHEEEAHSHLSEQIAKVVAQALNALDLHEIRVAHSLAELGDIDLPEGPSPVASAVLLEPLGSFYLAYELELAGLLRTADLVAGLFASGAITATLGTAAQLLRNYWRDRHNRLTEAERMQLFQTVFEAPHFERLFAAFNRDIARHADNLQYPDWREAISLEQTAQQLIGFFDSRAGGMTSFAARDIATAINEAIRFLRDRALQAAFGVTSLWGLVRAASDDQSVSPNTLQQHVDRGKSGLVVFSWLAGAARNGNLRLDPNAADFPQVVAAAQTWLAASDFAALTPTTGGVRDALRSALA